MSLPFLNHSVPRRLTLASLNYVDCLGISIAINDRPATAQIVPAICDTRGAVGALSSNHRIEFVLPTITLYVDPNWLGPATKWNLVHAYGANCPTWPVKADGLEFGSVWIPLDIHSGLGRKLIRLGIGPQRPDKLAAAAAHSQTAEAFSSAYIEDLTTVPPQKGVFGPGTRDPLTRIYRIHYPRIAAGL